MTLPTLTHRLAGPLIADPTYRNSDYTSGMRMGCRSVYWSWVQPTLNTTDTSITTREQGYFNQYRSQGWSIGLDPALHKAPAWVLNMQEGQLKDNHGVLSGTPNLVYNGAQRTKAQTYLQAIIAATQPDFIKLSGLGEHGECVYPKVTNEGWWIGNTAAAQSNPFPTWQVGTPGLTFDQVVQWDTWYRDQAIDMLLWQIDTIRAITSVPILVPLPGVGCLTNVHLHRLQDNLSVASADWDPYRTLNVAAVYNHIIYRLAQSGRTGLWLDCTSLADGSGTPADNAATSLAADDAVTDATVFNTWSASRYQSKFMRAANQAYGSSLQMIGETTGFARNGNGAPNTPDEFGTAFQLMDAHQLVGVLCAFDYNITASSAYRISSEISARGMAN